MAGATVAGQGPVAVAAAALALPALVDLACACTAPLERRLAATHVRSAAARLARVAPKVVAITGSFGKTSTKGYVAHLVGGARSVVASPASFNNRAGLARAVNEHLADGTEVFVAEMGTYGRGRDRRAVLLDPSRRGGDHRHRPGAPGALRHRGPRPGGQGRDPGGRALRGARRRRRPPGNAGRDECPQRARACGASRVAPEMRTCPSSTRATGSRCTSAGKRWPGGCASRRDPATWPPPWRWRWSSASRSTRSRGDCPRCPSPRTGSSSPSVPAVSSCSTTPTTPTPPAGAPPWRP